MHKTYTIKGLKRATSIGTEYDWGYGFNVKVETDEGELIVATDKMHHPVDYGFVQVELPDRAGAAFVFDRRLIATLADIVANGAKGMDEGTDIRIKTEAEADETYERLGIPKDQQTHDKMLREGEEVDIHGTPTYL